MRNPDCSGAPAGCPPPDFQVPHGDFEPGAKGGILPDGGQPLGLVLGEHLAGSIGEVGGGPAGGATHPAPELVELGQAEGLGIFDDKGVHVGQVDARLDDGGAHQDVQLPVGHLAHDVSQLLLVHFPWAVAMRTDSPSRARSLAAVRSMVSVRLWR